MTRSDMKQMDQNIKALTDSIDSLKKELTDMKESLNSVTLVSEGIDKKLSEISQRFDKLEESISQTDRRYNDLKLKYNVLHERMILLESQSRRDNLLFDGLPESLPGEKESQEDCVRLIREILQDRLQLHNVQQMRIVRCHRVGRPPSTGTDSRAQTRPRAIIVKFHWYGDRDTVLQARSKLKGSKIFISEDFPKEIIERRKTLTPIMMAARRKDMRAFLVVDKLHTIKDNRHNVYGIDKLNSLPPELDPNYVTTQQSDNVLAFFGSLCPLSNFHESPFECEGRKFRWVEEYFFHRKAELCNDLNSIQRIRDSTNPAECKRIGEGIKLDRTTWHQHSVRIMKKALQEKFGQNRGLRDFLLETGNKQLAEASPTDKFWGTGVALGKVDVTNPSNWPGKNKLGELLMEIRTQFKN